MNAVISILFLLPCLCVALPDLPPFPQEYMSPEDVDAQDLQAGAQLEPDTVEWEPKDGFKLGQVTGVGVDSEGNIHLFHRGSRVWDMNSFDSENVFTKQEEAIPEPTHVKIDPESGDVMEKKGANEFFLPHGLTVDHEDNVWLTDVAMHQVFKFPKGGANPTVWGEKFKPGSDSSHFCKPTDVAVATTGEFFVADGYCNSRIMKFSKDGTFVTSFGKSDVGDAGPPFPAGDFAIPHSVALIEDWNVICVADRENERVQCFSAELEGTSRPLPAGTFIKKAENLGHVFAIRSIGHNLIGVTNNEFNDGKESVKQSQLFIVNLENGDSETFEPNLKNPHAIAVAEDDKVYVGEIGPNRLLKIQF